MLLFYIAEWFYTHLNDQIVLFLIIQFSISHLFAQFKCQTVLLDPLIGPYQVLPFLVRVDLGAMAMKGFSKYSKASIQDSHHQFVSCYIHDILLVGSYSSAEMQSLYYTAPTDWAKSYLGSMLREPLFIFLRIFIIVVILFNFFS